MIVDQIGEIADGVYMLGHRAVPIFLVDGRRPALFDCGLAFLGRTYAHQIRQILNGRQPAWCFLTHSHFDHCGAAAYLKTQFPQMKVVASDRAAEVLGRPSAIRLISDLNRSAAAMAADFGVEPENGHFEPFAVDVAAGEGDRFAISAGLTVHLMQAPGHTRDFLCYYLPRRRLLVASEALGTPDESGYIVTDCLVDYDMHYHSMQRLNRLAVEIVCLGHVYSCTGTDARHHLEASLTQSRRFRKLVERFLEAEKGDVPAVMQRVKAYEWDGKTGLRQPETAYVINLEARVKAVMQKWRARRQPDRSSGTTPN